MDYAQVILFIIFATSLLGSPGPATISLASTGMSFGLKKSIPFMLGIYTGFAINLTVAAVCYYFFVDQFLYLIEFLRYVFFIFILYLSYQIYSSFFTIIETSPFNFYDGVYLNLLNPKAYLAAFAIYIEFLPQKLNQIAFIISIILLSLLIAVIVQSIWCLLGAILNKKIMRAPHKNIISKTFAVLLVLSLITTCYFFEV